MTWAFSASPLAQRLKFNPDFGEKEGSSKFCQQRYGLHLIFFSAPSSKISCLGPLPVQPIPLFHTLSRFGGRHEVQVVTEIGFQEHMAVCCNQLQANVIKQT